MSRPLRDAPQSRPEESRAKLSARQLRRVIVWTEILGKPVSRRAPRSPKSK